MRRQNNIQDPPIYHTGDPDQSARAQPRIRSQKSCILPAPVCSLALSPKRQMGNDQSRSSGGQSIKEGPPDYYKLLQVSEDATEDDLRVRGHVVI